MPVTRWGILGCGSIAHAFATGLKSLPDAHLVAVGSRSQEKAEAFGAEFNAPHRHGSYAALAADPDVDIVYVATPHPMHADDSILCLNAGKAVLSEKPFTVNAAQAEKVIACARANRQFLMEGMWSRFFPAMRRFCALLNEGAVGEARMLQADFGFRAGVNPESRLFNPALGGGALLDVGCYCVSLASMVFGVPEKVEGVAHIGETGVDEQAAMTLRYGHGRLALLSTAIRTNTPHEATVWGTEGWLKIQGPWWKPEHLLLSHGGKTETVHVPYAGNGFNYEAAEAAACLHGGKMESDLMPLDETLTILKTLDALRAHWGLKYPME